ncbi:unnamed protein product [Closterium sp. NIES-53]
MDAGMASWKSTGTYVDEVPPPGANIVNGMWIFRVKQLPGSPPAFKACYVARGFSQRQVVDYFETFSPTPKMTTLRVLLHVAAQRDYALHSLDFSTAFLQGSRHEEIRLRRPPGFTVSTTLAALGFAPSTANPSLFLCTNTSLSPFYVLVYVDDLVFATADTEALTLVKSELQKRHTCTDLSFTASASISLRHSPLLCLPATRSELHFQTSPTSGMGLVLGGQGPVVLTGHTDASWVDDSALQRSSQGYTFSLGSGSVFWWSTRSSSVLSSICEAEIYAGATVAQELRWLTYLLIDLGEQPRSPPFLYVDNKAMIALYQEHGLEQRTKHIALRYFLARELQQRGQLRLAYVATWANTADVFTKALPPSGHQRFSIVLGLSEVLGFESQCVHLGHPSAGGCQRSIGDPRLILGKGFRYVVMGGYGRTDPLLNKPFDPNGLVVGIMTYLVDLHAQVGVDLYLRSPRTSRAPDHGVGLAQARAGQHPIFMQRRRDGV